MFSTRSKLSWPECREEISSYICPIYPAKIQLDEQTHVGHLHNSLGINSVTWNTCGSFDPQPSICVWCVGFFSPHATCYMFPSSWCRELAVQLSRPQSTLLIHCAEQLIEGEVRGITIVASRRRRRGGAWRNDNQNMAAAPNSFSLSEGGITFTLGGDVQRQIRQLLYAPSNPSAWRLLSSFAGLIVNSVLLRCCIFFFFNAFHLETDCVHFETTLTGTVLCTRIVAATTITRGFKIN